MGVLESPGFFSVKEWELWTLQFEAGGIRFWTFYVECELGGTRSANIVTCHCYY